MKTFTEKQLVEAVDELQEKAIPYGVDLEDAFDISDLFFHLGIPYHPKNHGDNWEDRRHDGTNKVVE